MRYVRHDSYSDYTSHNISFTTLIIVTIDDYSCVLFIGINPLISLLGGVVTIITGVHASLLVSMC